MTQTYAIPIHSMTDQITNSSTVIFTYSEGSEKALKEMVNELFSTFGIDKTCDDVFSLRLGLDDNYVYYNTVSDMDDDELPEELKATKVDSYSELHEIIDTFLDKVFAGEIEKPEWMEEAEKKEVYDYFRPSTTLYITPKKPEYAKLAELVTKFLYSTSHEATQDG